MVKVVSAGPSPARFGRGKVYLVGAGPGDPELLTIRAYRLLQNVDVVVYDRLVSAEIMALIPRGIECLSVGKDVGRHCVPQEQINELIVALARTGKKVLRLKGGDPYIFGRGGEEAEVLVNEGIPFEVVPGITAASGASTYCGIPLTHRDYAQSVTFVTGHLKNGGADVDWQALARPNSTLVVYMGMSNLEHIVSALKAHGRSLQTPVAIVREATRDGQQVLTGTLGNIAARAIRHGIKAPATIIVGEVVALQEKLEPETRGDSHGAWPLSLVQA